MFITLEKNNLFGFFMHKKAVFALAGVFLAIALIVPPIVLLTQADNDLDNYANLINNPSQVTGGNATFTDVFELNESHQTAFIIVLVVEVVFIALFVVTVWFGINHYHGELDSPKKSKLWIGNSLLLS
jgi:uncharacterized membrane protein (UPF0182 family)